MKRILAGLLALALLATPSFAQGPPSPPPVSVLAGQVSLSVSNVSARVAIPSAAVSARALTVYNSGANDAYIATGTIAVVATSGGTCAAGPSGPSCRVPAGSSISFYTGDAYLAAITAASTTTLVIYQGTGPVALRIYGAPNGAAPTGPAGGDLAGTYPNPTVTQATNGFTVPSSGVSGLTLCNTADCVTNYERLRSFWSGNIATINTEAGGTGVLRGLSVNGTTLRPSASTSGRIDFAGGGSSVGSIDARWASTLTASSGTQTVLSVQETISQSGSAGYTALLLNPTETGTGSGSKFLLEGKIGAGADVFTVDNAGLGRLNGVGINGAPVASSLISVYNATPAERVELGINGSAVGLGLGSGGMTLWGPNATPGSYDTGLSRDSVLGALNVDVGNGTANDKSGTLNLGIANIGANGAASVAPLFMNGTILTGGTGTTNFPALLIQPAGTTAATTWNTAGTGIGLNLASGFGGNFIDAYKNGAFVFNISNQGQILTTGAVTIGAASNFSWNARGILSSAGAGQVQIGAADAASPVSQIFGIQNVVAGTSNTAGPQFTIRTGSGTGTGIGGNTVFQYAPHDVVHTVNTFTGSASPYTIGFTAGNITTYPIGTVMTVSGCTTATLNGTYTVTASSSGSVTATTSATGTGSPTTCQIVGNTSQNAWATALTINGDTAAITAVGSVTATTLQASVQVVAPSTGPFVWSARSQMNSPSDGVITFANQSGTAFTRLNLGGTTSSFGAWQPNGTETDSELADGSGLADIGFKSIVSRGTAPTASGTCTRGAQTGGHTAGTIVLTCTAQTLILTFTTTAPNGWMCEAIDQTTTADTMKQTSNTTTSCTLTGTTAASDVVIYQARAY